jgi:acetoin utilization deacetylase AcuC-like enzyme
MLTFFDPNHHLHAPEFEFYRGKQVPCFENPSRADFVYQRLKAQGHVLQIPSQDSTDVIAKVHSQRYIQFLQTAWRQWQTLCGNSKQPQPFPSVWPVRGLRSDLEPKNFIAKLGLYSMDNGTPLDAGTWVVAKMAADAAVQAASHLRQGERAVFCATRPPGHHAGSDFMGGYCFLNYAAIAAQALLDRQFNKVAILDVDFHHGNGTQEIFYDRADVLYASVHGSPDTEFPFYLGYADETGSGRGQGANLNIPLAAKTEALQWFAAFDKLADKTHQFKPEALVISLGLDTYIDDPISQFKLTSSDFTELGKRIGRLNLPTIFILEGGYAAAELGINAGNVLAGFESTV